MKQSPLSKKSNPVPPVIETKDPRDALNSMIRGGVTGGAYGALQQYPVVPRGSSVAANPASSALSGAKTTGTTIAMPISERDVETLGDGLQEGVMGVVEQITKKQSLGEFGALGDILFDVQNEADKLVSGGTGITGALSWVKSKVFDVRKVLTKRLTDANTVFDQLCDKLSTHIAEHQQWITDLQRMKDENYQFYRAVVAEIVKGEAWEKIMRETLANQPAIDPNDMEAPMKAQAFRDAEARINRLTIKLDFLRRLKVLSENNSPTLSSMQDTSLACVDALKLTMGQGIPLIRAEFAKHLQTLRSKDSLSVVKSTRNLMNSSLQKTGASARDAAIEAAEVTNEAMVSNDTLTGLRNMVLETVAGVRQAEQKGQAQRVQDADSMKRDQAVYLQQLQGSGARLG